MKMPHTTTVLKDVLNDVQQDEATAIEVLCELLETVEKSRNFECLPAIREVVKEWQNRPPGVIVASLSEIRQKLNA